MSRELKENAELAPIKDFIVLIDPARDSVIKMPDSADGKVKNTSELVVIKFGPDCKNVQQGDRLIVDSNAVVAFRYNKELFFMTREENVGCVIR